MEPKNNGGAAFPTSESNYNAKYSGEGMTLRAYMAAKAMAALIAVGVSNDYIPAEACKLADAMLAELAK